MWPPPLLAWAVLVTHIFDLPHPARHSRLAPPLCQAKRGAQLNAEALDLGGWRQVKTATHYDNCSGAVSRALDQFWHGDEASEPDNMNQKLVRIELGIDEKSGEKLYALHPRRVQKASTRRLLPVFRRSAIASRLREETCTERTVRKTRSGAERVVRKGRDGVKVSWRRFSESKCACIKKRKPSECVCLKCSYLTSNVARLHHDRRVWHRMARERIGGGPCVCHIHPRASAVESAQERAAACVSQEEAYRAAVEEGGDGAAERWAAALADRDAAELEVAAALAKAERARKYDEMFESVDKLTATLMPCGKENHEALSIIGAGTFQAYKRGCIFGDCANRMWRGSLACGFKRIFGAPCPTEASEARTEWRRWEKRLRSTNDEGKEFHALEWVPAHGTRAQLWAELLPAIKDTLPHIWRNGVMMQAVHVFEDRKSGRHAFELEKRRRLLAAPQLLAHALDVIVNVVERRPIVGGGLYLTLRALKRLAATVDMPEPADVEDAKQAATKAEQVHQALSKTATVQSDYASQLETNRTFHATCATKERHNYLVTLVGYRSWREERARPRKAPPRRHRRITQGQPWEKPLSRISVPAGLPELQPSSSRYPVRDSRSTYDFKQCVDALLAFHKSGFKPNARSYNVVMEDVCHFLKYGTVLHGEWFIEGQRVPLAHGAHRSPLPPGSGLSERPIMPPDFPEMERMEARTDGCPNQFDYGTNYHQTAAWRAKTAHWALTAARAKLAQAEAALKAAMSAFEAASEEGQEAAAEALEVARAEALVVAQATQTIVDTNGISDAITRAHTKLIEYHGKGGYDSLGYMPKLAVEDAIQSGAMLNPGTIELVHYLALTKQTPTVAKADKSGWEAPGRYIWAYYDTSKFTKFTVPDASSFKGCQENHRFIGLCEERSKAERDGPLRAVKLFCACDPCLLFRTEECLLPALMGRAVRAKAPLAKGTPAHMPQLVSLQAFADSLDAKMLVAVTVDESEVELEGPYWLALLSGAAFVVDEDMLYCGQQYRKGWLVAPGQWYALRQRSERGYELQPEKVLLVVNHMIFLKNLTFTSSQSGPQGRTLRANATGPAAASRSKGSGLSFFSEDSHNLILDALGVNDAESSVCI